MRPARRRCAATAATGEPCGAAPLKEAEYCFAHSPEHAQEAAEARRLGGLRRRREATVSGLYDLEELSGLALAHRLLAIAVVDTLSLDNSVARSRLLVQLVGVSLRVAHDDEFDQRLAAIEQALGGRKAR